MCVIDNLSHWRGGFSEMSLLDGGEWLGGMAAKLNDEMESAFIFCIHESIRLLRSIIVDYPTRIGKFNFRLLFLSYSFFVVVV